MRKTSVIPQSGSLAQRAVRETQKGKENLHARHDETCRIATGQPLKAHVSGQNRPKGCSDVELNTTLSVDSATKASIILVPTENRERIGDFIDDVHVRALNAIGSKWIVPDSVQLGYLQKFMLGDYMSAPAKSWLACRGLRIGYDDTGVYFCQEHTKRYVGLPLARVPELDENSLAALPSAPSAPGMKSQPPACMRFRPAPVLKDHAKRRDNIIRSIFNIADKDGNGYLSWMELGLFLRRAIPELSQDDMQKMFTAMDSNHSDGIDEKEFTDWMHDLAPPDVSDELTVMASTAGAEVHALFRLVDHDGSGGISKNELAAVLGKACPMKADELSLIFDAIDVDQSGCIDYDEFIRYVFAK